MHLLHKKSPIVGMTLCFGNLTSPPNTFVAFPDLEFVKEQKLSYLEGGNVDSMFLLRKVR